MNKILKKILEILMCMITVCLAACQDAPQNSIVASKNDGSFDASVSMKNDSETNSLSSKMISYSSNFNSTDFSVSYQINFENLELYQGPMPIIRVAPHEFSVNEVKQIANTLFPTSTFYESNMYRNFSKEEIEEKIVKWGQMRDEGNLKKVFGDDEVTIGSATEAINSFTDRLRAEYESAPEIIEQQECQWTFFPYEHYMSPRINQTSGSLAIQATTSVNDISYMFCVVNRNQNDYRIHNIQSYPFCDYISPMQIDYYDMLNKLYSENEPTKEQLDNVREIATELIDKLNIGQWNIDSCSAASVSVSPAKTLYYINITATPRFNNAPVTRQTQLTNLKSEQTYASNYYYTDLNLSFTNDGKFTGIEYTSPVDVEEIVNENVLLLSSEQVIGQIEKQLALRDVYYYDQTITEANECTAKVFVNNMELGLVRVKVKDNSEEFYYLPGITVYGNYIIEDYTGNAWYNYQELNGSPATLLVLNAVDGSIINVSNGY